MVVKELGLNKYLKDPNNIIYSSPCKIPTRLLMGLGLKLLSRKPKLTTLALWTNERFKIFMVLCPSPLAETAPKSMSKLKGGLQSL
jgi:hypothetical protein